jgi:outer membrane protein assembly factor BamB
LKPLISDNALVFFDKKGSLIKYNKNAQIIWKKNFYSKSEKKLSPKLSFALQNDKLIVVDNVANFYLVDFENGNLVWSKKNEYPFNSEVKIFRDKFLAIDYNNNIKCFNIADGTNCWTLPTENAFTIPNNKYSLILVNDLIIFNNSIGDITALNAVSGSIIWQLPTQSRSSIMQTYNLQTSKLVTDGNSIFFSNNKNEFYSLDLKTGSVNWKNEVNSLLTPIILNDLIFTVSDEGYLFVIQKDKGNIIRINDLYSYFKEKKRKSIEPTGFIVADKKLYLTNNNGNLITVDLVTGSIMNVIKIGRDIILQPQIHNKNLYLIKNGNIISYD